MTKLRGSQITALARYVKMKHSFEFYNQILMQIDADSRKLFEDTLAYNEFYDLAAYGQFLKAYMNSVSKREFEQSARDMAEHSLKGIFLVFARLLSKEFLIKKMGDMWRKFYSEGAIELVSSDDHEMIIRIGGIRFNKAQRIHSEIYMRTLLERATGDSHRSTSKEIDANTYEFRFNVAG